MKPGGKDVVSLPPAVKRLRFYREVRLSPLRAPVVRYRLDAKRLARPLSELDRRRELFEHLVIDPIHTEWFRHRAWVRTIHGTTRIEGNTLNALEVEELLAEPSAKFDRKEALEVLNTREALEFGDRIAKDRKIKIDEPLVREIHGRVLDGIDPLLRPGQYRTGPKVVADPNGGNIFATPVSGDVPQLMREFGLWLRAGFDRQPAPVAAALAHLELVAIHPFFDGNGRTARALARVFLVRYGLALAGLVSLEAYLDINRSRYFAAIRRSLGRSYRPGYDATPFVVYLVNSISGAADHALARIRGLGQVLVALRRDLIDGKLPRRMLDGLVYAWINGSIRPADYIRITGASSQNATRDFNAVVARSYLVPHGATKRRRYVIGERLQALGPLPAAVT